LPLGYWNRYDISLLQEAKFEEEIIDNSAQLDSFIVDKHAIEECVVDNDKNGTTLTKKQLKAKKREDQEFQKLSEKCSRNAIRAWKKIGEGAMEMVEALEEKLKRDQRKLKERLQAEKLIDERSKKKKKQHKKKK